ncbi:uncharacterized protein LOC119551130 [Drosophila subpulchrella]|uniref:uncharacterized protein LOC119551130 n=1 Tax=Drosophila subpulchrella TaxID=1486046 RepID=UPI0018A173C8|nr:uncharacterized protein LOC119551130 [Drosophila subpulchrella]
MKLIILLALFCQIHLGTPSFDHEHAYRKCTGIVYLDCRDYCDRGCKNVVSTCLHHCQRGCGCIEASILRNNGGCKRLVHCADKIIDSASAENQDYAGEYVTDWWGKDDKSKSEESHSQEADKSKSDESHSEESNSHEAGEKKTKSITIYI